MGGLDEVEPVRVATYIEHLGRRMSAPSVKQHLACIRMLFDWLVTGQVVPVNPAHSVRGPRHSVSKGVTPVLSSEEATALLAGMNVSSVVGLRDRAIIAVMTYTFARVGAVIALKLRITTRRRNAGGFGSTRRTASSTKCPAITSSNRSLMRISTRPASRKTAKDRCSVPPSGKPSSSGRGGCRARMFGALVRRRAADAGIETPIGCHTFRATALLTI